MSTYQVRWMLAESASATIMRYCANCGRVVPFTDSGKVRRNANGKDIYAFAIYKCPKDHTWNKSLDFDPLNAGSERMPPEAEPAVAPGPVSLTELREKGFRVLAIQVLGAPKGVRLDRVLAQYLTDVSRSEIQRWIEKGRLTVDGRNVKASYEVNGPVRVVIEL